VLALLFGTLHLLRRARLGAPGALAKSPLVASRGRLDLGTGREIRLVEVSGRLLVVGVTNESMQLLADLPQTEAQGSESASPVGARNAPVAHPTELPWQPSGIGRFLQRLITSF
jgi:flagellar biogenesis protein FliO